MGKLSLSEQAFNYLLGKLNTRDLIPGDLINRRQVADEMGISVAPVLEAMLRLESQGFLETIPRKGTRVRLFRPEEVIGLFFVREALECQVARMIYGDVLAPHKDRFIQMALNVERQPWASDESWRAEVEFHRSLAELTGASALLHEYDRVMRISYFYMYTRVLDPSPQEEGHSHIDLIDGLLENDPTTAEECMRTHLRKGKSRIFSDYGFTLR